MRKNNRSVADAVPRPAVQRILAERARQKLAHTIKDPATLDRIAFLIEGAAAPTPRKFRARKVA